MINTGDYSHDPYPETQLKATVGAVAALMKAYGITTVVGHSEVASPAGRKTDPGPGVASEIRKAVGLPAE
jgi:N-acetyl-anhydromuramyl-L-alanine amidase AmpD